jgi:hypothetical protein
VRTIWRPGRATGYLSAFGVREGVGTFSEVVMFRRVLGHIRRQPVAFVALLFAVGGGAMAALALADTTIGADRG